MISEQVDNGYEILVEHIFCLVNMQLESLYICLKIDYLMSLYEFFITSVPTSSSNQGKSPSKTVKSTSDTEVQTQVHMLVKNPEIVLLENQQEPMTNGLVLNVSEKNLFYQRWNDN